MILEVFPPTFIAEGTRLQGSVTFFSASQVFGLIEGEVNQQSLEPIQIGKSGWVHGNIASHGPVLVEGRIEGHIRSATQIKLLPSAVVSGILTAPVVVVQAGALFDGELKMKPEQKHPKKLPVAA